MNLHSEARITSKIREEIKASEVNMSLKGVFPQWSSLPVIIHADEMKATLTQYLELYNHPIVQRNLGHLTPVKALNK